HCRCDLETTLGQHGGGAWQQDGAEQDSEVGPTKGPVEVTDPVAQMSTSVPSGAAVSGAGLPSAGPEQARR
ncbi:MAG: hypothetical protein ACRDRS_25305, partial [Pseudonocardiaceae bacterium]